MYFFVENYPFDEISLPPFKAPEIDSSSKSKTYTEKVDIFSYGVILYKLFVRNIDDIPLNDLEKDVSKCVSLSMKELICNCLSLIPDKRFPAKDLLKKNYFDPFIPKSLDPNSLITKKTLFPYQDLAKPLGSGGFGSVFLVRNIQNGNIYAVKKIREDKLKNAKARDSVLKEIKLLNSLRDVGFTINLIEAFIYNNNINLVLEYCNGGSLRKRIHEQWNKGKHLTLEEIRLISWNLAEGLNELHNRNIVHRDLKPENVLLISNNEIVIDTKLCDLGLGKQLNEKCQEFTTVCGTEEYMAPELLFQGHSRHSHYKLTNKIDVYSYGLILFSMIFNNHQFKEIVEKIKHFNDNSYMPFKDQIQFPSTPENIPNELIDLIKKCLEYNPNNRPTFANIILNPFFNKLKFELLSNEIYFKKNEPQYESDICIGMKDLEEKLWIKLYKVKAINNSKILSSIKNEINFLERCKSIPHIASMNSFGIHENQLAIVFEYYNGSNLLDLYKFRKG